MIPVVSGMILKRFLSALNQEFRLIARFCNGVSHLRGDGQPIPPPLNRGTGNEFADLLAQALQFRECAVGQKSQELVLVPMAQNGIASQHM